MELTAQVLQQSFLPSAERKDVSFTIHKDNRIICFLHLANFSKLRADMDAMTFKYDVEMRKCLDQQGCEDLFLALGCFDEFEKFEQSIVQVSS